jgi:transcriptional regulator with XRE-family HTH domain
MNNIRDEEVLKAFGQHLKRLRKSKKMSQMELAQKANISLSQIARIELGLINTTISTIHVIASALEIDPYKLLKF